MKDNSNSPKFSKVVHIGSIDTGYESVKYSPVFCKIEFDGTDLSISGVVGPWRNGNCAGSCGQIIMGFKEYDDRGSDSVEDIVPAKGWSHDLIRQFFDTWNRWHLNDLNPACEHQRALGWGKKKVDCISVRVYSFYLIGKIDQQEYKEVVKPGLEYLEERCKERIRKGLPITSGMYIAKKYRHYVVELGRKIMVAKYRGEAYQPQDETESALIGNYNSQKVFQIQAENKTTGWLYPTEHREGVLTKECPVCGYKYGSAWLTEKVPPEVVTFLCKLPNTDITPAWV